ncbi:MAG: molybdopterin molybdotransferase MoeA [Dethiobacter sp.]|nr:molybdopterin molybdotransferase MoeA [Dethiobacter sp.]
MLRVLSVTEAREKVLASVAACPVAEIVGIAGAVGRVLAGSLTAPGDLPPFARATMDGYVVAARDTFGATESMPALLTVAGEILMGCPSTVPLGSGQAVRIATGGMLPAGGDAVVMVEHTELLEARTVAVGRSVAPGENVIDCGEDLQAGEAVLPAGHRLRPQDSGVLAALGYVTVAVNRRPRVALISTGDELVPPETEPAPGQIRDANSALLAALVRQAGAEPMLLGIVPDREEALFAVLQEAASLDCVILSGGSSAGTRDLTATAIDRLGRPGVLFHGVSMRPGKPFIFGVVDNKPYFGLSGNPTSALVGFLLLVRPLLWQLAGAAEQPLWLSARVERSLSSASGREDYFRAYVYDQGGEFWAKPVMGQAGLLSTMLRGNALLRIPQHCEGVEAGEKVAVLLL